MINNRINHPSLYSYGYMVNELINGHTQVVHGYLKATLGDNWRSDFHDEVERYRALYEALLMDDTETLSATERLKHAVAKITTWRRAMRFFALQATDPHQRKLLLKATGRGLGRSNTPRQCRELLAKVEALFAPLRQDFASLGAHEELLNFPQKTLHEIEQLSRAVRDEKAQDTIARSRLKEQRDLLVGMLNAIDNAARAAYAQGMLLNDDSVGPATLLIAKIKYALEGSLTRVRRRRGGGDQAPDKVPL